MFRFCSAPNEVYFVVWLSPVVQSSDCTHLEVCTYAANSEVRLTTTALLHLQYTS